MVWGTTLAQGQIAALLPSGQEQLVAANCLQLTGGGTLSVDPSYLSLWQSILVFQMKTRLINGCLTCTVLQCCRRHLQGPSTTVRQNVFGHEHAHRDAHSRCMDMELACMGGLSPIVSQRGAQPSSV